MAQKMFQGVAGELEKRLRAADRVFVLTGAGVSAESGVPTFRGGGGAAVWKGMPFSLSSSAEMVERDLPEVWAWFDYRRERIEQCRPNPAHETLARWQDRFREFTLVTQNIDGLHAAAGSREVFELHGNIGRGRCTTCNSREKLGPPGRHDGPPPCSSCGGFLRPDVVLFGEMLPAGVFELAAGRAAECEVCLVVGTSALVYPAAGLPLMAKRAGAVLVEVNPETTPLTQYCDLVLEGRAGELLSRLDV